MGTPPAPWAAIGARDVEAEEFGGGRDCMGGAGGMMMPSNRGRGPGFRARSWVGSRPA